MVVNNDAVLGYVRISARFMSRQPSAVRATLRAVPAIALFLAALLPVAALSEGTDEQATSAARREIYLKAYRILEGMSREIKGAVLITAASGPKADSLTDDLPKRADFVGLDSANLPGWRNQEQKCSGQIYFVCPVARSGRQELCIVGYWIRDVESNTEPPLTPDGVPLNSKDDTLLRCYVTDSYGNPPDVWKTFDFSDPDLTYFSRMAGKVAVSVRRLDIRYYKYVGTSPPVLRECVSWDSLPSSMGGTTATDDDNNKLPVAVGISITVGDENDLVEPVTLSTVVHLENASRHEAF